MKKIIIYFTTLLVIFVQNELYSQVIEPSYCYDALKVEKAIQFYDASLLRKSQEYIQGIITGTSESVVYDKSIFLQSKLDVIFGNFFNSDVVLSRFITEHPNSPYISFAALQRGYLSFEQKKLNKAESLFADAQKISASEFAIRQDSVYFITEHYACYWRGISLALQGKHQDAQVVFEECYRKFPNLIYADDALFALGLIAELNRNYDVSLNYFRTISKKYPYSNTFIASKIREINNNLILRDPNSALLSVEKAERMLNHIQLKDSIGNLFEAQSYSENATEEILYLKGEAYNLLKNFDNSIGAFQAFLSSFPNSPLINYVRLGIGWAFLNKGDYSKSIKFYDSIIKEASDSENRIKAIALLYRAVALKMSGDIDQAKKEFSALSLQSNYPYIGLALLELGQIQYEAEDWEDAARTLERADREATEGLISVRIHLLLGATYFELRKWDKAFSEFKSAESIALKSSDIYMPQKNVYLAESRLKQGISLVKNFRYAEAIPPLIAFISEQKNDTRVDEALFWLSEAYYRTDMLKNAIEKYQAILNTFPNSNRKEESLYGLGWSYFRQKDFDNSSKTFEKMIAEFPDSKYTIEVLARQADGYYVTRNYKKAAEYYRKASKAAPNTEEGQYCSYQLCHALYRQAAYEESITALLSFVRSYPKSPYAPNSLYLIGWIRFQQKKYKESIDDFQFLIQAYPQSSLIVRAHYAIGDAHYNLGDFEAALNSYKTIVDNFPSNQLAVEAIKSMQYCYLALGRNDEAVKIADSYIESNPTSPFAADFQFKKGELFYNGRNFKDAVNEYDNFIRKYPDNEKNAEAMFWMARSYVNLNEPENAVKTFENLETKFPKSDYAPQCLLERALLFKQLNDVVKADSLLLSMKNKYPESLYNAQAGFERAIIKYGMGDTLVALNIFNEVASQYKGNDYSYQSIYRLAMHFRLNGKYDSALVEFKKLIDLPNNVSLSAESYYRIGEIYMRQEDWQNAISAFNDVKDRFSGIEDWYSLSLLNLGECYEKVDNTDSAKEIYQVLVTINPDNDFGQTAKRRLKVVERKK